MSKFKVAVLYNGMIFPAITFSIMITVAESECFDIKPETITFVSMTAKGFFSLTFSAFQVIRLLIL